MKFSASNRIYEVALATPSSLQANEKTDSPKIIRTNPGSKPTSKPTSISHKPVRGRLIVDVRECQQVGRAGDLVCASSEFALVRASGEGSA